MTMSHQYSDSEGDGRENRRIHHRVREVFPEACALLVPMLEGKGTVSSFALGRAAHDRFGDLGPIEVDILVKAIRRFHLANQPSLD
jgi:hypothetical protein